METRIAPVPDLIRYAGILQRALVVIRNYGLGQDTREALFCGLLADVLHELPELLLHYDAFDPDRFWREVRSYRQRVPPGYASTWDSIFQEAE
jgi:hypothetical protein